MRLNSTPLCAPTRRLLNLDLIGQHASDHVMRDDSARSQKGRLIVIDKLNLENKIKTTKQEAEIGKCACSYRLREAIKNVTFKSCTCLIFFLLFDLFITAVKIHLPIHIYIRTPCFL